MKIEIYLDDESVLNEAKNIVINKIADEILEEYDNLIKDNKQTIINIIKEIIENKDQFREVDINKLPKKNNNDYISFDPNKIPKFHRGDKEEVDIDKLTHSNPVYNKVNPKNRT